MSSARRCVLAAIAVAGLVAPGAQAATWSEVASGTTEDITAVEYQSPSRLWFATGAGSIFKRVGDTFVKTGSAPGVVFRDIEFQDDGPVGFAVGTNGGVLRSADAGSTWAPVTGIAGGRRLDVDECAEADQTLGDVDAVRFAGNARAWLLAGGTQIFRTVDGSSASGVGATADGWQLINDNGVTCKIGQDVDDLFAIPGSSSVYFAAKELGTVLFSLNALATTATVRPARAGAGATGTRRLAGDPANPNRQWAVDSGGAGPDFGARTTDGWATSGGWTIANPDRGAITTPESIDSSGGTVVAVGSAGMIAASADGATFHMDPAAAAPSQDWRSVSLASPSAGAAGGTGGRLVTTSDANVFAVAAPAAAAAAPAVTSAGSTLRPPALVVTRTRLPVFGFPPRSKPPVAGGSARRRGAFVIVAVAGTLRPPAGLTAATACRGRLLLTVSRARGQRRELAYANVGLPRSCRFEKVLRIRRTRVGGRKSLRLRVAFKGNAAVDASSVTYVVPVR